MIEKLKIIFRDTLRSLRRFFLEVLALFFVALAVIGIASIVDEYRRYSSAPDAGILRLSLSALFAFITLISVLHSFWRARKLR